MLLLLLLGGGGGATLFEKSLKLTHFESDRHEIFDTMTLNDIPHRLTVSDFLFSI
jgi:hypothetical protein